MSENKPSEFFKRPKFKTSENFTVQQTTLVSRNKPNMMTGIVKAVTKKLEPEDPFQILVVDY